MAIRPIERRASSRGGRWMAALPRWVGAVALCCALATPLLAQRLRGAPTPGQLSYDLWREGYQLHAAGAYEAAIKRFTQSIAVLPTAEAYTSRGWSLSKLERYEEAIGDCKAAIALDPDYGNPYNDIGAYLIDLGRLEEAVPWLKKATQAKRYCCYSFPYFNLGRVLLMQGHIVEARRAFEAALKADPTFAPAREALERIRDEGRSSA